MIQVSLGQRIWLIHCMWAFWKHVASYYWKQDAKLEALLWQASGNSGKSPRYYAHCHLHLLHYLHLSFRPLQDKTVSEASEVLVSGPNAAWGSMQPCKYSGGARQCDARGGIVELCHGGPGPQLVWSSRIDWSSQKSIFLWVFLCRKHLNAYVGIFKLRKMKE